MNTNFKPLGLAAAVATAAAGYTGVVNAQASYAAASELGDLAIVPYYTVMEGFATGVNIVNTADVTQVIKFRFRRAPDSMDALDFNVVLSPKDMYTGFISTDAEGDISWTSNDNSCTVPAYYLKGTTTPGGNKHWMPGIYRTGADTGYIEIISMGTPESETSAIALDALHDGDGVPADCDGVRDHFFNMDTEVVGNVDSETTIGYDSDGDLETVNYVASPDSLKVSYFIKSDATGVEFGDNAVHIKEFLGGPSMTNQETGIFSGDFQGFDHPDLNGGAPLGALMSPTAAQRSKYNDLRAALGAEQLINDWSANSTDDFSVDTDWVVTIPGQYVMLHLPSYLVDGPAECYRTIPAGLMDPAVEPCDFRDIPMTAVITVTDREEKSIVASDGELVVSPQPPVTIEELELEYEVNVIEWGAAPVLNAPVALTGIEKPAGSRFGWASLVATSADSDLAICDINLGAGEYQCVEPATGTAPMVGFVAWQRNFGTDPALAAANYGRIVEHSRVQSAAP